MSEILSCPASLRGVPHPEHEYPGSNWGPAQCPGYSAQIEPGGFSVSEAGLSLNIVRSRTLGDCSLGGVSAQHDQVTLVGVLDWRKPERSRISPIPRSEAGPFMPKPEAPPALLVYRTMGDRLICHVEPLVEDSGRAHFMAGGTYLTGDSRFSNLTGVYGAVSFHDRREF